MDKMDKIMYRVYVTTAVIGTLLVYGTGVINFKTSRYQLSNNTNYKEIGIAPVKSIATIKEKDSTIIELIDKDTKLVEFPDKTKSSLDKIIKFEGDNKEVFKRKNIDNSYEGQLTKKLFEKYNAINDSLRKELALQKKATYDATYNF